MGNIEQYNSLMLIREKLLVLMQDLLDITLDIGCTEIEDEPATQDADEVLSSLRSLRHKIENNASKITIG